MTPAALLPLFVYGTLRRGPRPTEDNPFARLLHGASDFVSMGRVRGSLYRIAHYPGWVENGREAWVIGEIWQPREPEILLARLDEYEGAEYARVKRTIEAASGRSVDCWAYLFLKPVEERTLILSGDWLAVGG